MARKLRIKSRSNIYHVILRGVNKQRIFEQPADYNALKRILKYVRETDTQREAVAEPNYFLYAYCIMDNHVHMLMQPNGCELGKIVSRITQTYAMYFNQTYERVGHLFQDRYKSEVVEDVEYFYTLLDYIHNNPVKAGLAGSAEEYAHSSCRELMKTTQKGLTPLCSFCGWPRYSTMKEMEAEQHRYMEALLEWEVKKVGAKPKQESMMLLGISRADVEEYMGEKDPEPEVRGILKQIEKLTKETDNALCRYLRSRLKWETVQEQDAAIVKSLLEMTATETVTEFQQLNKKTMRTALAYVRDTGVSLERLSRLTGISIGVIRYAKICYPREE